MSSRTTVVLDERARVAVRQLAQRYGCSASEAIRRSVVRQRDAELGLPSGRRRERARILKALFGLFEGNDPREEVRRLKSEDAGF